MTVREAGEMVLLGIYGGRRTADDKISLQEAMYQVLMDRDYFIGIEGKNLFSDSGDLDTDLFVTYGETAATTIPILWDEFIKKYYCILPLAPLGLRDNMGTYRGIDLIYQPDNRESPYWMVERGMVSLVPDVANHVEGNISWMLTHANGGKKVVFQNMTPATLPSSKSVCVDMIPQVQAEVFDTIGGTDKISIPAEMGKLVVQRAIEALAPGKGQTDTATDNVGK